MAKRLELLKDAVPLIKIAGLLANATNPVTTAAIDMLQATTQSLNVRLHPVLVRAPGDLDRAFSVFEEKGVEGIVVQDEPMIIANAKLIADLATKRRMPLVGFVELTKQGGALAYSIDFAELYRQAAKYVVKIIQGARPGDLPVEQPTKFHLVVNIRTMKALGLEVPTQLLARADDVIE
jgi:putative tryptophan/tyrosine transport system substrate-binding protein